MIIKEGPLNKLLPDSSLTDPYVQCRVLAEMNVHKMMVAEMRII